MFDEQFQENGSFVTRSIANRHGIVCGYVYYQGYRAHAPGAPGRARYAQYVGPADDSALMARVERFNAIKAARKVRGNLVNALAGAGLPRPPVAMGRMIEALAKAGIFRLRAVLVGTAAYQTFPAILGTRLNQTAAMTGDVDVAQFRSISIGVEGSSPPILETLRDIDPTFHAIPGLGDPARPTAFANAANFRLDILTAHRGGDEQMGKPMAMAALGGAAAQPLRFLDYLIREPVRSVVLYGPGVSVNVPAPARFAVHKLIVSGERPADAVGQAKSRKDLLQAGEIILALVLAGNATTLRSAFREAWERGPRWRQGLRRGAAGLDREALRALGHASEGNIDAGAGSSAQ